jgi:hypothetical protein
MAKWTIKIQIWCEEEGEKVSAHLFSGLNHPPLLSVFFTLIRDIVLYIKKDCK